MRLSKTELETVLRNTEVQRDSLRIELDMERQIRRRAMEASWSPAPTVGRILVYESKIGDGITSPAIVLRTRQATDPSLIERWGPGPDGTVSGAGRPEGLVAELPNDHTVDLLVHGLGGDYREYAVPYGPKGGPRTWRWPERA